ncbi:MAG: heme lyase NrfEFG subunit NrfE, partial [Alphaproteobacteria bacterium]
LEGVKITVGPPYFARVFTPIAALVILMLGVGPHLPWKRAGRVAWGRLFTLGAIGAGLALGIARLTFGPGPVGAMAAFALGGWLVVLALAEWGRRLRALGGPSIFARLRRLPRAQHGMTLAHLGLAVLVFGVSAAESFTEEHLVMLAPGEVVRVGAFDVRFDGVEPVAGPNYTAIEGHFTARRNGHVVTRLAPQQRTYWAPPMETTEAAIRPFVTGDLYVVIGDPVKGRWSARLYWKPLVGWIWIGALMIAFGGLIALSDRRLRIFARRRSRRKRRSGMKAGMAT